MPIREQREPFYFIDQTVNVLIVDGDPGSVKTLTRLLEPVRIYRVASASSTRKAVEILEAGGRMHLGVMDLGLDDMKGDEFFLLRNYSRNLPFVIVTGSTDIEKGFAVHHLGARAVVAKSSSLDYLNLLRLLNHHALVNVINPRYRGEARDPLSVSTGALFAASPAFVTAWALEMRVTDRELRYIWKKNLGANAKIILFLYQLFQRAFAFYEGQCAFPGGKGNASDVDVRDTEEYEHLEEYFHLHRSTILDYLAFGSVAAFI